ncbi:unnamed protein product, partial [Discosporangium mesarthrocarpum]
LRALAVAKGPSVAIFTRVTEPPTTTPPPPTSPGGQCRREGCEGGAGAGAKHGGDGYDTGCIDGLNGGDVGPPAILWQAHQSGLTSLHTAVATGPCSGAAGSSGAQWSGGGGDVVSRALVYTSSMDGSCKEWEVVVGGAHGAWGEVGGGEDTPGEDPGSGEKVDSWGSGGIVRLRGVVLGAIGRTNTPIFGCAPSPNSVLIAGVVFSTPAMSNTRLSQMKMKRSPFCRVVISSLLIPAVGRALGHEDREGGSTLAVEAEAEAGTVARDVSAERV